MKESLVSKALKITLYIIFGLGIAGTATLPLMLDYYMRVLYDAYSLQPGYRAFILPFMMIVAVMGLYVVFEMIRIMRSIPTDPFVERNARCLYRIGFMLIAIAVLFFLKCLLYVTFLTMACGFLFIICGLFAFTLCNLFRQAVAFKDENDLTI